MVSINNYLYAGGICLDLHPVDYDDNSMMIAPEPYINKN